MIRFFADFSLVLYASHDMGKLYFRGAGTTPYVCILEKGEPAFLGLGLTVASLTDLQTLAEKSHAPIEPILAPGGGHVVRLTDPDGFGIEVLYGQEAAAPLPVREPLLLNTTIEKKRLGTFQRLPKEPARVIKLGHVALNVRNFAISLQWYQDMLGFQPSDILYDGEKAVGAFLHCQLGLNWVDHHTVAIFETPTGKPHIHHASFEVEDLDAVFMGHEWLQEQKYRLAWGVGRHICGSQIFDYWFNPDGFMMEHYSDGDLVNESMAPGHHPAGPASLYQWGHKPPEHFLD